MNVELVSEPVVLPVSLPVAVPERPLWQPDRRDWIMLAAGAAGVLSAVGVGYGLARVLGKKMQAAGDVPVAGGTDSLATTPPEVAKAQKQLSALQWAIPGLTGAMLASSSLHEEQQRPSQILAGVRNTLARRARD